MASKDTDLAEASQALFCALIDYVGVSKMDELIDENSSYAVFKDNWESNKLTKNVSIIDLLYKNGAKINDISVKDIKYIESKNKNLNKNLSDKINASKNK